MLFGEQAWGDDQWGSGIAADLLFAVVPAAVLHAQGSTQALTLAALTVNEHTHTHTLSPTSTVRNLSEVVTLAHAQTQAQSLTHREVHVTLSELLHEQLAPPSTFDRKRNITVVEVTHGQRANTVDRMQRLLSAVSQTHAQTLVQALTHRTVYVDADGLAHEAVTTAGIDAYFNVLVPATSTHVQTSYAGFAKKVQARPLRHGHTSHATLPDHGAIVYVRFADFKPRITFRQAW